MNFNLFFCEKFYFIKAKVKFYSMLELYLNSNHGEITLYMKNAKKQQKLQFQYGDYFLLASRAKQMSSNQKKTKKNYRNCV